MYKTQFVGSVAPQPAFTGVGMISKEKQEVGSVVGRVKAGKEYVPKPRK